MNISSPHAGRCHRRLPDPPDVSPKSKAESIGTPSNRAPNCGFGTRRDHKGVTQVKKRRVKPRTKIRCGDRPKDTKREGRCRLPARRSENYGHPNHVSVCVKRSINQKLGFWGIFSAFDCCVAELPIQRGRSERSDQSAANGEQVSGFVRSQICPPVRLLQFTLFSPYCPAPSHGIVAEFRHNR